MQKVMVAQLDDRRVFQGMVEVDFAELAALGDRFLPHINECDLPAGQYRWEPIEGHPLGGHFLPLPPAQRANAATVTLDETYAFDLMTRALANPEQVPDIAFRWLDAQVQSFDFAALRGAPLVVAYAAKRGIVFGDNSADKG